MNKIGMTISGVLLAGLAIFLATGNIGKMLSCNNEPSINRHDKGEWQTRYEQLDSIYHISMAAADARFDKEQIDNVFKSGMARILSEGQKVAFVRIIDSLKRENNRLVEVSIGSGEVHVSGGGAASDNAFSDEWIDARATIDSNRLKGLEYQFNFGIGDIRATLEDNETGEQKEIYDVFIKSLKDTTKYLYIGGYERMTTTSLLRESSFQFWNPRLNVSALWGGPSVEVAATLSLASYRTSGDAKGMLVLAPDIGASSNFHDPANLIAGARYNIAHNLPLLTNLHVVAYVGTPFNHISTSNLVFRFGVGSSL